MPDSVAGEGHPGGDIVGARLAPSASSEVIALLNGGRIDRLCDCYRSRSPGFDRFETNGSTGDQSTFFSGRTTVESQACWPRSNRSSLRLAERLRSMALVEQSSPSWNRWRTTLTFKFGISCRAGDRPWVHSNRRLADQRDQDWFTARFFDPDSEMEQLQLVELDSADQDDVAAELVDDLARGLFRSRGARYGLRGLQGRVGLASISLRHGGRVAMGS